MARIPATEEEVGSAPLVLNLESVGLSPEQFFRVCRDNPGLHLELTARKELVIMTLPGGKTGRRNAMIVAALENWARSDGTGIVFSPSTLFFLPNGAMRAPDASWLRLERWEALSEDQQEQAPPLCPDFVVELRSPSDRIANLQSKMEEYVANGARLGWLIDPFEKRIHVYRPGLPVERLDEPRTLDGGRVAPGFVLDLSEIL